MAESLFHLNLVNELVSWISATLLNGDIGLMLIDRPESGKKSKPPKIGGYIPDIFVTGSEKYTLIIGEAKTAKDLERNHSIKQIREFLLKCKQMEKSMFVLAVPWHLVPLANSLIKQIVIECDAFNVEVKILEKLAA